MMSDLTAARPPKRGVVSGETAPHASEIERAAAVLRSVEPDLEVWRDGITMPERTRTSPAWLVIGVVWVSTLFLIGAGVAGVSILVR